MIRRALISVSDKTGIVDFAKQLEDRGVSIISTGGTHKVLAEAGISVMGISEVTNFPECLDGRVKTLHPNIHAALLADRKNPDHLKQLEELGIEPIDLVVVNLYPFKDTIEQKNVTLAEAIENIDIGGPSILRSSAKNFEGVVVLIDPNDYDRVIEEMDEHGDVTYDTRFELCTKAFEHTSYYDSLIANFMNVQRKDNSIKSILTLPYDLGQEMRYGENPHQKAAFYRTPILQTGTIAHAKQLHGIPLSYNNINDANAAISILKEFNGECAVVAVKHANPCGVGTGETVLEAFNNAYESDPVSIFGGIVATNREVDEETAREMSKIFLEIVIAPSFTPEALFIIEEKKNIRILTLPDIDMPVYNYDLKKVHGGLLIQEADNIVVDMDKLQVVTEVQPTEKQMHDMLFAMKVVKHVKSNAIVIAKNGSTIGIGPGQTNRIGALNIALGYAGDRTEGAVVASDGFFPFPDCVEACHEAGIKAIMQPGGSKNDQLSIDACNKYGIAMVFTGIRHFCH